MISTRNTKCMLIGNSQLSKQAINPAYFITYMVTSIEQKVFTFKHDLNIGQSIIVHGNNISSPSTVNKWKSVLQVLLTHIRLTKGYVIFRLTSIILV